MSGNSEVMVGPEDVMGNPDEVAKADPMGMSQMMSLEELMKAQNAHIDNLEETKKKLQESLATKVTETDEAKKALARELELSAEKTNALVVAKAKQEELEKELGVRQKTEAEKLEARKAVIKALYVQAAKLAWDIMTEEIHVFNSSNAPKQIHRLASWFNEGCAGWKDDGDFRKNLMMLTARIYDELKAAEEAEKNSKRNLRFTEAEIAAMARRTSELCPAISGGYSTYEAVEKVLGEVNTGLSPE